MLSWLHRTAARDKYGAFAARCRSYGFCAALVGAASCRDSPRWHKLNAGHEIMGQQWNVAV